MLHTYESLILEGRNYIGKFEAEKQVEDEKYFFDGAGLIIHNYTHEEARFGFQTVRDNFSYWSLEESLLEFTHGSRGPRMFPTLKDIKPRFSDVRLVNDLVLEQMFEDAIANPGSCVMPEFLDLDHLMRNGLVTDKNGQKLFAFAVA